MESKGHQFKREGKVYYGDSVKRTAEKRDRGEWEKGKAEASGGKGGRSENEWSKTEWQTGSGGEGERWKWWREWRRDC